MRWPKLKKKYKRTDSPTVLLMDVLRYIGISHPYTHIHDTHDEMEKKCGIDITRELVIGTGWLDVSTSQHFS